MIPQEEKTDETEEIKNLAAELDATRTQMQNAINQGANWFFIIAVFSVVNTFLSMGEKGWFFVVDLGVTMIINQIHKELELTSTSLIIILNLLFSAIFAMFGIFARKKHLWGFIAGMILYALDALLLLVLKDFLGFVFHLLVLFFIFKGVRALSVFEKIEQKGYFQPPTL